MKKILFYPQKTLNEYTSIMRDCIDKEKYILHSVFPFAISLPVPYTSEFY